MLILLPFSLWVLTMLDAWESSQPELLAVLGLQVSPLVSSLWPWPTGMSIWDLLLGCSRIISEHQTRFCRMKGDRFLAGDICLHLQVSSAQFRSPGGVGRSQEQFERYLKCEHRFSKAHAEPFPGHWHGSSRNTLWLLMFPGHPKPSKAQDILWRVTRSHCQVTSPVSRGYQRNYQSSLYYKEFDKIYRRAWIQQKFPKYTSEVKRVLFTELLDA